MSSLCSPTNLSRIQVIPLLESKSTATQSTKEYSLGIVNKYLCSSRGTSSLARPVSPYAPINSSVIFDSFGFSFGIFLIFIRALGFFQGTLMVESVATLRHHSFPSYEQLIQYNCSQTFCKVFVGPLLTS